jgi:hypothetical protein
VRRVLRDERGQASAELMGMAFWLLLAAVCVWQLMLAAWTVTQAANAARTAGRVAARAGGDPEKAARNALSRPLRDGFHDFELEGEKATVRVRVPIIVPGLDTGLSVSRSATLPR